MAAGLAVIFLSTLFVSPGGIVAATTVNPTADGTPLEWSVQFGAGQTLHWQTVADSDTGSYLYDNYADQDDWFATSAINNVFKITQVDVITNAKYSNTLGWFPNGQNASTINVYSNINLSGATKQGFNNLTTSWVNYTKTWTGTWGADPTKTSFDTLQVDVITCDAATCGAGPWTSGSNWYRQEVNKVSASVTYEQGPTGATAAVQSDRRILVQWVDNSTTESIVNGFKIYQNGVYLTSVAGDGATTGDTHSYTATGLTPGTSYYYRITATDGTYESNYTQSNTVTTANSEQTRYRIGDDNGTTPTDHTWKANENNSVTLNKGTNFRVRIQMKNTGGSVSLTPRLKYSTTLAGTYNTITATCTDPVCVTGGTATDGASFAPEDLTSPGGTPVNGYYEETSSDAAGRTVNTNEYTEYEWNIQLTSNASPGQAYYFRVYFNSDDTFNTYTNTLYVTTQSLPADPTIGTPTALSTSSIRWNFTDNASNEDGFRVHDPSHTVKATCASPDLTYCDEITPPSNLSPNTQYTRHVHAYNTSGDSASGSANASAYTWPNPPTSPTASGDWDGAQGYHVDLSWSAGTGGANHYHVYRGGLLKYDGASTTYAETGLAADTLYSYDIYAVNGDNVANPTPVTASDTTPPAAPTGLTHTANDTGSITWSWAAVSGATSYKIYKGSHSDSETDADRACVPDPTSTSCTQSGLDLDTQYTVHVHAINANGKGAGSSNASAYTSANQPGTPTLTAGNQQITIVVNQGGNPAGPSPADDTRYAIACDAVGTNWLNKTTNLCTGTPDWQTYSGWGGVSGFADTGLNSNQQYTYAVKAENGDGDGTDLSSSSSKYTLAADVTTGSATVNDWTSTLGYNISVSWTGVAANHYHVKSSSDGYATNICDSVLTNCAQSSLSAYTAYTYRIYTVNEEGAQNSTYFETASVTTPPDGPTGLGHAGPPDQTTSAMKWTWGAKTGAAGYTVGANAHSDSETGPICENTANIYCNQGSLSANTSYTIHVHSTLNGKKGAPTSTYSAYTSLETPTNIDFDTLGETSLGMSSNATLSNLAAGSSHVVFTFVTSPTGGTGGTSSGNLTTDNYTDDILQSNDQYCYRVQAFNGDNESSGSAEPTLGNGACKYTWASQVSSSSAQGDWDETSNQHIDLGWNLNGATSVRIARVSPSGDVYTGSGSSHIDNNLNANQLYAYRIYSLNGESAENSNYVEVSDTTPPAAPTNLRTSSIRVTSATVAWDAVAGPSPTYTVSHGTDTNASNLGTQTTTSTNKELTGLIISTTYFYKIRAANVNGTGPWSALPNPSFTTSSGATKLLIKLPNQDFEEGIGITGSPNDQVVNQAFNYTVYAADDNNMLDDTATDLVTSSSSDERGVLPPPGNLVAGQATFSFTPKTLGNHTIIATGSVGESTPFNVIPGDCSATHSTVTADPLIVDVKNKSTIVIVLKDADDNVISDHTVSVHSNQSTDQVTFFGGSTVSDPSGVVVAYLGTSTAHTSTVTVRCETDSVELATKPQIQFVFGLAPPPVAKIVAKDRAVVNTDIIFDGQGSIGDITNYAWDFGDATSGTQATETHNYPKTGSYNVSLTVTDIYGRKNTTSHKIDIVPPSPVITNIERVENDLKFYGTSIPNGNITLYIDLDVLILTGKADAFGNWTIVYPIDPGKLSLGAHSSYATVTDENNMTSDPSDTKTFDLLKDKVVITPGEQPIEKIFESIKEKVLSPSVTKYARPLAGAAVGLTILAVAMSLNLLDLLPYLLYLLTMVSEGTGLKKKRKSWGVVYDASTKKPIDLAIIRIYHKDTKKLLETRVTDKFGRFGFLVEPGEYYITVTKSGYVFASKLVVQGTKEDDVFSNLYHGAAFEITKEKSLINVDIPVDPVKPEKRNALVQGLKNTLITTRVIIRKILIPLLIASFILACLRYFATKELVDALIAALMVLLLAREVIEGRKRFSWGIVYDALTKKPIENALVKIYDRAYNRLRETRLTDKFGRYGFLVPPGDYYLEVLKSDYNFPSKTVKNKNDKKYISVYHGETLNKTYSDSLISANIPLDPKAD